MKKYKKNTVHSLSFPDDWGPIMGILNITSDSFYDGGKYLKEKAIEKHVQAMLAAGASIIDVGACSTRPGALVVDEAMELKNVLMGIRIIQNMQKKCIISVDTFRANIAARSIQAGAHMINDISAGSLDSQMLDCIRDLQVPYVLMHMRGTPQTMPFLTDYGHHFMDRIFSFFEKKINTLSQKHIKNIILDPGFGFAKTVEQNFLLLQNLDQFAQFQFPLMVGLSRKSMIYKTLQTTPLHAGNGTTVLHTLALTKGAHILRVHDVKEAYEAITLYKKVKTAC